MAGEAGGPQVGTLRYMAPEQVQGLPLRAQADLFSVAVVAHECLTGRPFVDPRGGPDAMRAAVVRPTPDLAATGASEGFQQVLVKALAADPAARFASASDFRRALAQTTERLDAERNA